MEQMLPRQYSSSYSRQVYSSNTQDQDRTIMASSEKKAMVKGRSKRRLDFDDTAIDDSSSAHDVAHLPAPSSSETGRRRRRQGQQLLSFSSNPSSTPSSKRAKVAIITPGEGEDSKESPSADTFIPVHVHKNLDYNTQGKAKLPETTLRAFSLICQTHEIPSGLEGKWIYGPLSGYSYEEKVLRAYTLDQLDPKAEYATADSTATKICIECAQQGHVLDECPLLL